MVVLSTGWSVAAVADFTGDGKADIFWRRADGANALWIMDGNKRVSAHFLPKVQPVWDLVGAGDFSGTGTSSLMWRNKVSGANVMWAMYKGFRTKVTFANSAPVRSLNWMVVGIADFTGDGHSDVMWRNKADNRNMIWRFASQSSFKAALLPKVAASWDVAATADYDGDRSAEILWRNSNNGANVMWTTNGLVRTGVLFPPPVANTSYVVKE